MTPETINAMMDEIQANQKALNGCPRHLFIRPDKGWRIGQKITCENCKGVVSNVYMGNYIQGYKAAGGDPKDICPDWNEKS
jgi:hypothetical protein